MTYPLLSTNLSRLPEVVKVDRTQIVIAPSVDSSFYENLGFKYRGPRRDQVVFEPCLIGHEHILNHVKLNRIVRSPSVIRHPVTFGKWDFSVFGPPAFRKEFSQRTGIVNKSVPLWPLLFSEWRFLCETSRGELQTTFENLTVSKAVSQDIPSLPFLTYDKRKNVFVYVLSLNDKRDLSDAGFARGDGGVWYTTSLAAAMEFAGEADAVLKNQLETFKALWPFSVRSLSIKDFNLAMGEDNRSTGSKKKKKVSAEEQRVFSYDCSSDVFFTRDFSTALALKLPPDPKDESRFIVADFDLILSERKRLDHDAEIGVVCRLIERLMPNDIEPWLDPPELIPGEKYDRAQIHGIMHAITNPVASLADDMGFGKTYMGVGVCDMRRHLHPTQNPMIMVIVPASQRSNWTRTLSRIVTTPFTIVRFDAPDPEFADNPNIRFERKSNPVPTTSRTGTVVIVGYEEAINTPQLFDIAWDQVIYDESHMAKNPFSLRGAALMPRGSLDPDKGVVTQNFLGMTGTETPLGAIDLYPIIIHALWRLEEVRNGSVALPAYSRFKEAFAPPTSQDEMKAQAKRDARKHRMERLARALDSTLRLRRLKNDTPGKKRHTVVVPCSDKSILAMAAREGELARILDGHADAKLRSATMSELSQLRQRTALHKIPSVIQEVIDQKADGHSCLVFTYHKPVLAALAAAAEAKGLKVGVISGDMSARIRQLFVDRFQGGEFDALFATYESAYQGYTITRASRVLHLELHNIADRVKQAEDRANRRGQTQVVHSIFFVISGSYDDIRAKQMMEKDENSLILSGDARRLIQLDTAA
jgi:superfamily II DNA or RNA helicase